MEAPGEKLAFKMWETLVDKGIGNILKPIQQRREGRTAIALRVEEMLQIAQAEKCVEAIKSGKFIIGDSKGLKLIPVVPNDTVPSIETELVEPLDKLQINQVLTSNLLADSLRKEVNIGKAILQAEAVLESAPQEPSPEPIGADWLYRWRDYAGEVSSEELQSLWGRVIAGEVKRSGSCSLRTMEFLRNLSQEEAKEIALLSKFTVGPFVYRVSGDDFLSQEGLTFSFLLNMQELGVLSGVEGLGINISWKSSVEGRYERLLASHGKVLIVSHANVNKTLTLKSYGLTTIGREVIKLGHCEPSDNYLRKVANEISKQGFGVQLADYEYVGKDLIYYKNVIELSLPLSETA